MNKKAAAYATYSEAAIIELLLAALPKIAHEMAAPMSAIDNLTIVSTEGAGALPRQVTTNMTQLQELLASTLGVDLASMLKRFESTTPAVEAAPAGDTIVVPAEPRQRGRKAVQADAETTAQPTA
jgi:flotillin